MPGTTTGNRPPNGHPSHPARSWTGPGATSGPIPQLCSGRTGGPTCPGATTRLGLPARSVTAQPATARSAAPPRSATARSVISVHPGASAHPGAPVRPGCPAGPARTTTRRPATTAAQPGTGWPAETALLAGTARPAARNPRAVGTVGRTSRARGAPLRCGAPHTSQPPRRRRPPRPQTRASTPAPERLSSAWPRRRRSPRLRPCRHRRRPHRHRPARPVHLGQDRSGRRDQVPGQDRRRGRSARPARRRPHRHPSHRRVLRHRRAHPVRRHLVRRHCQIPGRPRRTHRHQVPHPFPVGRDRPGTPRQAALPVVRAPVPSTRWGELSRPVPRKTADNGHPARCMAADPVVRGCPPVQAPAAAMIGRTGSEWTIRADPGQPTAPAGRVG